MAARLGWTLSLESAGRLLIVGGPDPVVIRLNEQAMERMVAEAKLEIVLGATDLFEEPGTPEKVAERALATDWFMQRMATRNQRDARPTDP